jgi:hypothetical protein
MNIVLTCLVNFQPYILDNIRQLHRLGHFQENIFILCNQHLVPQFRTVKEYITVIEVEELDGQEDEFRYDDRSGLDNTFRGGFWKLASSRFFVIHRFMNKYNVRDVLHLENDVVIYYHGYELMSYLDPTRMYLPFDNYERNIASIVYIPDANVLGCVLRHYDMGKNDMYNFSSIAKKTNLIDHFPIFCL